MITKQQHNGFIKVEEYSLAAWLAEIEQVINQGYKFDFESNDTHPQAFGSMYTAVLVPVVAEVASEVETEVAPTTEYTPEVQAPETTPVEPDVEIQVEPTVQTKRKNAKN